MTLDVPTLTLVTVFVTTILGALLLACWWRDSGTVALAWWGAAYLTGAFGMALLALRKDIAAVFSIDIANAVVLLAYTFLVAGARSFNKRETPVTVFLIAPLIWLTARQSVLLADINVRIVVVSAMLATMGLMTAFEFWRARNEPLLSRWPAIVVLGVHGLGLTIRIPLVIVHPLNSDISVLSDGTFALMSFGTLIFTITLAFILLAMTKERGELRHKTAARIDPLTGLANRRAFLDSADELAQRCAKNGAPVIVLLADLDRFKSINDRFGHATGDRVLQVFADTIRRTLRARDVSGRLGGEEFAIVLPGTGAADAGHVAERVRSQFCAAARMVGAHAVGSTVSIGVAVTSSPDTQVSDLLAVADRALYRAKAEGRNRVVVIDGERAGEGTDSIALPATEEAPFSPSVLRFAPPARPRDAA